MASSEQTHSAWKKYPALTLQSVEDLLAMDATEEQWQMHHEKAENLATIRSKAYLPNPDDQSEIFNIVLLGKTGAGKSSTGNLLLGEERFMTSGGNQSCTQTIQSEEFWVDNMKFCIIDTPGFFDTSVPPEAISTELLKIVTKCDEGINAFVFVRSLGTVRTTPEERQAFENVKEVFGEAALDHCIFLFTRARDIFEMTDLQDKTIEGYVRNNTGDDDIYGSVGQRIIGVENVNTSPYEKQLQRKGLIDFFYSKVYRPVIKPYTNEVFEEAKRINSQKRDNDGIDKELDETVSKYLENYVHSELKQMSIGVHDDVVKTIMEKSKGIPRQSIQTYVQSKAQFLTDKKILKRMKKIATALFKGAGVVVMFVVDHVL